MESVYHIVAIRVNETRRLTTSPPEHARSALRSCPKFRVALLACHVWNHAIHLILQRGFSNA
jgi:hypothetical protein